MAREPDVSVSMTESDSLDIFLTRLLRMNFFSVIVHLPGYKATRNTRSRINSWKHVIIEKNQAFTIV